MTGAPPGAEKVVVAETKEMAVEKKMAEKTKMKKELSLEREVDLQKKVRHVENGKKLNPVSVKTERLMKVELQRKIARRATTRLYNVHARKEKNGPRKSRAPEETKVPKKTEVFKVPKKFYFDSTAEYIFWL